jgi:release factor glutamine methyltransferase
MRTTFYDLPFETAPGRVFRPRPATEALVDAALERIDGVPMRIADVGTGGAIAVALAVNRPQLDVWATDTSPDAVALARTNAERNGVADRVHVVEGDLLAPIAFPVDLVVANLP